MEDYTKFRLKGQDELDALLEDKDNAFVISCNKCFKEYAPEAEPEPFEITKALFGRGKNVAGCVSADFLCNKTLTGKLLTSEVPASAECVIVAACGLGAQTVAALSELPVYAACDSIGHGGAHGMALTNRLCDACGQCYLNMTGGVCPVVDCSKSLLNGQCGGAKGGKCEVDKEKDCAWEKICARLAQAGTGNISDEAGGAEMAGAGGGAKVSGAAGASDAAGAGGDQPPRIRDHSKNSRKAVGSIVASVREKRLDGYYGGIHPHEGKHQSEHLPITPFPLPKTAIIPLSQHAGAPAKPLVSPGDSVKTGQPIGEPGGFISAAIHASICGTVSAVEPRKHPGTGLDVLSVVIESDGSDELHESVRPSPDPDGLSPEAIIEIVAAKGIVGMGGAGFPASVKLKPSKPIDTVLLNGCECEPLLTADHRVLLEYPDEVLFGLIMLKKATGAERGVIAIEDNKQDAILLMSSKTAGMDGIEVLPVRTKYPQGAEKMLIKRALGRSVPSGGLPMDVGVIVSNVSTAKAICDAIKKGMPLIERVVSVTGSKVKNPGNYAVRIGTSVKEVLAYAGGPADGGAAVKLGGPMMGVAVEDLDVPVIKGTNGIIAVDAQVSQPSPCIRCGRCVDACPMELLPLNYPQLAARSDWDTMEAKAVRDCMECGCCDFVCSSKIPIRDAIKLGKKAIADKKARDRM